MCRETIIQQNWDMLRAQKSCSLNSEEIVDRCKVLIYWSSHSRIHYLPCNISMSSHCGPGDTQILLLSLTMWLILGNRILADMTQSESKRALDHLELLPVSSLLLSGGQHAWTSWMIPRNDESIPEQIHFHQTQSISFNTWLTTDSWVNPAEMRRNTCARSWQSANTKNYENKWPLLQATEFRNNIVCIINR